MITLLLRRHLLSLLRELRQSSKTEKILNQSR